MKLPFSWHGAAIPLPVMWRYPGLLPCLPSTSHRAEKNPSGLTQGSLAEHMLERSSAHFSPPIHQLHRDNPKTTARTNSTIHHCQVVGHNPLVRSHSPFHTNTHHWEQHKQRTTVVKLPCLRTHNLQTIVRKGAEVTCFFHSGQKGKFISPHHNKKQSFSLQITWSHPARRNNWLLSVRSCVIKYPT